MFKGLHTWRPIYFFNPFRSFIPARRIFLPFYQYQFVSSLFITTKRFFVLYSPPCKALFSLFIATKHFIFLLSSRDQSIYIFEKKFKSKNINEYLNSSLSLFTCSQLERILIYFVLNFEIITELILDSFHFSNSIHFPNSTIKL